MKKIMILGASYSQVPLIRAAKRLGLYTIACSTPGDWPGFAEADEASYTDISKPEEVLKAAEAIGIDGIATCCMDIGLLAQGYVCSRMGLPGPSYETAKACTNKYLMKEAYMKGGVNTAKFVKITCREDLAPAMEQLRFPLIIKAVDQMGSRGIYKCLNEEEVYHYYDLSMAASKQSYCILEEFLIGQMFGVEAMVSGGKPAYILPIGNQLRDGNPPFPIGHSVPWEHADTLTDKVLEQVQKAIDALGFDNCPMDFDAMLADGEVYFIESTARAGATGIADMVSIYFGIDYFEAIVKVAMGEDPSPMFRGKEHTPCLTHLYSSGGTGRVKEIVNNVPVSDQIVDLSFNIKPGDQVQRMTNGRDRIGQAIIKGSTLDECFSLLNDTLNHLSLEIEESNYAGIHRYPLL